MNLHLNCVAYIDDIQIPHTFYSFEDSNNKWYVRKIAVNGGVEDKILAIPIQNHTGTTLATSIKSKLYSKFGSGVFTCTYNERKGAITFSITTTDDFMIMTDDD